MTLMKETFLIHEYFLIQCRKHLFYKRVYKAVLNMYLFNTVYVVEECDATGDAMNALARYKIILLITQYNLYFLTRGLCITARRFQHSIKKAW
jgi:hypothetical protein